MCERSSSGESGPPDGPLHLMLISAAFAEVARTASSWSAGEDDSANRFFAQMAEMVQIELSDPARVPTVAAIDAVSFMARAYAKAAEQIRGANTAPELGHAEIKAAGTAQAAEWLQNQSDSFEAMASALTELKMR